MRGQADKERVPRKLLARGRQRRRSATRHKRANYGPTKKEQAPSRQSVRDRKTTSCSKQVRRSRQSAAGEREAGEGAARKLKSHAAAKKELIATVLKPAEVSGSVSKLRRAEAAPDRSMPRSASRFARKARRAEIFQEGEAEAKAMNVKAEGFQEYNQRGCGPGLFNVCRKL